jgi:hypothetical protein
MIFRPRFALAALVLLIPAGARASDYSDFRIPPHSWSQLELALDGAYSPSFTSRYDSQQSTHNGSGLFSGTWLHGHDSERLQHQLQISGQVTGNGQTREFDGTFPVDRTVADNDKTQALREYWALLGEVAPYPWSVPIGLVARVAASGVYAQEWRSDSRLQVDGSSAGDPAQVQETNGQAWSYSYNVAATLGAHWGRVRDVTGIQRVQFVEDRLIHDRVVQGRLQSLTKQRLADLFYTESKFSLVHDLPDRYLWAEFERILREDPAVRPEALDSYAIFHAADPLVVSRGFGRLAGRFVGPVLTFVHENDVLRSDAFLHDRYFVDDTLQSEFQVSGGFHSSDDRQEARAGAEASIEQPLGLRWQLSAFGTATADVRAIDRDQRIQSALAVRYWQGERWYWETKVSQQRRTGTHLPDLTEGWSVSYGSTVSYYLEDHVSVDFGLTGGQTRLMDNSNGHYYSRSATVHLGISCRRGSLTAPGLMAPVRPVS